MPTYDLICHDCNERFELFLLRLLKESDKRCPSCGSSRVRPGVGGGILGAGTAQSKGDVSCSGGGSFG